MSEVFAACLMDISECEPTSKEYSLSPLIFWANIRLFVKIEISRIIQSCYVFVVVSKQIIDVKMFSVHLAARDHDATKIKIIDSVGTTSLIDETAYVLDDKIGRCQGRIKRFDSMAIRIRAMSQRQRIRVVFAV